MAFYRIFRNDRVLGHIKTIEILGLSAKVCVKILSDDRARINVPISLYSLRRFFYFSENPWRGGLALHPTKFKPKSSDRRATRVHENVAVFPANFPDNHNKLTVVHYQRGDE